MNWLSEYRGSLKNVHAEELLDIYLYRPIAFVIVKLLYSLPLTPNNYSFMSFASGMAAAVCFYNGQFMLGAFFFFMLSVFDCCDGMQARMKKNGTEFGRFVDGLVDYVSNITCYVALGFGVVKYLPMTGSIPTVYLVLAAGFSKALHAIMYDHYLMEYMSYDRGDTGFTQKEIEEIREKIKHTQEDPKGSKRRLLILKIYLGFTTLQGGSDERKLRYDPKDYIEKNYRSIQMWGLIGPAWHITLLIISFLFNHPEWLFFYSIVFGNLWLIFMLVFQQRINVGLSPERILA